MYRIVTRYWRLANIVRFLIWAVGPTMYVHLQVKNSKNSALLSNNVMQIKLRQGLAKTSSCRQYCRSYYDATDANNIDARLRFMQL